MGTIIFFATGAQIFIEQKSLFTDLWSSTVALFTRFYEAITADRTISEGEGRVTEAVVHAHLKRLLQGQHGAGRPLPRRVDPGMNNGTLITIDEQFKITPGCYIPQASSASRGLSFFSE